MTAPEHRAAPGGLPPVVAAWHRAMPLTRLLDYGMDPAGARRLLAETAAGDPWTQAAERIADERREQASAHRQAGRLTQARRAYRAAAAALMFAQMPDQADTPDKKRLYAEHLDCVAELTGLGGPPIERVEPQYRNGRLLGWLCLPDAGRAEATVIVCGGLSGWGAAFLSTAEALTQCHLACLLVEGPGQGWPRLAHNLYLDQSVAEGFSRFVDELCEDPRLGGAVGVQGNSFGGLFAAHLAARDPRIGACVVNGAPAVPVVPEFRSAREQIVAALGQEDPRLASAILDELRFDPAQRRIDCPLLVLHGGADPLVTWAQQEPFLASGDPATAERHVWPDGEHTLYNHAPERDALTADWFAGHLLTGEGDGA